MLDKIILLIILVFSNSHIIVGQEISRSIENKIDTIFKEFNNSKTSGVSVAFLPKHMVWLI